MAMVTPLPRRGSVDLDDPGFDPQLADVNVWLDGIEQRDVITYDLDQGLIVRVRRDQAGRLVLNAERDEVERETLRGEVRVARRLAIVGSHNG